MSGKPDCPAHGIPIDRYRLMADGVTHSIDPHAGYSAILGINMADSDDAPNPLRAMGVRSWIVELPRAGEPASGRLILNPGPTKTATFTMVETLEEAASFHTSLHDAARGCLYNSANWEKFCGAGVLDTRDPRLGLVRAGVPKQPWGAGTPAEVFFADHSGKARVVQRFTIGASFAAKSLEVEDRPGVRTNFILTGLIPYLAFSVLYDPDHHALGFKARPPLPNLPHAVSIEQ